MKGDVVVVEARGIVALRANGLVDGGLCDEGIDGGDWKDGTEEPVAWGNMD